jgi:hypothetical protein
MPTIESSLINTAMGNIKQLNSEQQAKLDAHMATSSL